MDVLLKFGDSVLNSDRILDFLSFSPVLRTFMQYLVAFCSRPEAGSGVISGRFVTPIVPDKC